MTQRRSQRGHRRLRRRPTGARAARSRWRPPRTFTLILWSVVVIAPLLWTLLSSFKTPARSSSRRSRCPPTGTSTNYRTAWTEERFGDYFLNTIAIVGSALVIVMLLGSMCAYVLARFQFPGNRLIYWMMLACLTFPIFLAIVPLFKLMQNVHLLNRQPGLVVVYVAFALPFTVFFLYPFFGGCPTRSPRLPPSTGPASGGRSSR